MNLLNSTLIIASTVFLTACGSSSEDSSGGSFGGGLIGGLGGEEGSGDGPSGGGSSGGGTVAQDTNFDDLGVEFDGYRDQFTLGIDRFAPASLPDGGNATYNGVLSLSLEEGSTVSPGGSLLIRGDMIVTADFGDDTLSGRVDNFSDSDADTYTGNLDITNGTINNLAPAFIVTYAADIDGDLTNDRTGDNLDVDAFFVGDFYGDNAELMGGVIRGEISTPDGDLLIWDDDSQGPADGDGVFAGGQ
jgi:hypothetical protein